MDAIVDAAIPAFIVGNLFFLCFAFSQSLFLDLEEVFDFSTRSPRHWIILYNDLLDRVYGPYLTGFRAIVISAAVSFALVSICYGFILFGVEEGIVRLEGDPGYLNALMLAIIINLTPDVLSLMQTRWIIRRFSKGYFPQSIAVLMLVDVIVSCGISIVAIWGYCEIMSYPFPAILEILGAWTIFSVFFYTTFFSSVLAIGFGFGLTITRIRHRVLKKEYRYLRKDAAIQIAWIGSASLFLVTYIVVLPIQILAQSDDTGVPPLCRLAPASMCYQVAKFTEDPIIRYDLFATGCQAGDPAACAGLGGQYAYGQGVKKDIETAKELLARACSETSVFGCTTLAQLLLENVETSTDLDEPRRLLEEQCSRKVPTACVHLSWLVLSDPDRMETETAAEAMQGACELGNSSACLPAAHMMSAGWVARKSLADARALLRATCSNAEPQACVDYAMFALRALGGELDRRDGMEKLWSGCNLGNGEACARYVLMVEWSEVDSIQALKTRRDLERMCGEGLAAACHSQTIIDAKAGRKISEEEVNSILKACSAGSAAACLIQGVFANAESNPVAKFTGFAGACFAGYSDACSNAVMLWSDSPAIRSDYSGSLIHLVASSCRINYPADCLLLQYPLHDATVPERIMRSVQSENGQDASLALLESTRAKFPRAFDLAYLHTRYIALANSGQGATDLLEKLVEEFPDESNAYYLLAAERYRLGQDDASVSEYIDAAIALGSTNPGLWVLKGSLEEKAGKIEDAIETYGRALDLGVNSQEVINNYVSLALSFSASPRHINRAFVLVPRLKDSDLWQFEETYAWAIALEGRIDQAAEIMRFIGEDAKSDPVSLAHMGIVLALAGDAERAKSLLEEARVALDRPWQESLRERVEDILQSAE